MKGQPLSLNVPDAQSREQRLGSITGYWGDLHDLTKKGCQGCLQNKDRCLSTASSCTHLHGISLLVGIEGAIVVDHGPQGCSAGIIGFAFSRRKTQDRLRIPQAHVHTSNMTEYDTVFGAGEKLRKTIRAAYERHHPKVIYVTTSCVSSIIGDDVYSITQEMTQELGIPVGYGALEGIKSKVWASGFDAFQHTVNQTLIQAPEVSERLPLINFIGFTNLGQKKIDRLFGRFGLEVNYLTGGATHENYRRASRAIGTFIQCGSQSSYLAGALEQQFGVKFFQAHMPYGGVGFERFIGELAAYVGKEDVGRAVIQEERDQWLPDVERLRAALQGKKVVLSLGGSYAFEFLRIMGELGVEVLHTSAYHFDPKLDNQSDDTIGVVTDVHELGLSGEISVSDIQQFEAYLLFRRLKPDFIVSRAHGASPLAVKLGIPAIEAPIGIQIFGYEGLVTFGDYIVQELRNTNFYQKVSVHFRTPFKASFEQKDPFHYLEKEPVHE